MLFLPNIAVRIICLDDFRLHIVQIPIYIPNNYEIFDSSRFFVWQ